MIQREELKLGDRFTGSIAAFSSGSVLFSASAQGVGIDLHMDADTARRLGRLLIEQADRAQGSAPREAAHPVRMIAA